MRSICLLLVGSFLLFLPAHAGHSPPKIILRVHVQTSGEGLPDTQAARITIPPNGESIQIRALPELTERDLVNVQADPSGVVHLQFNQQGQIILSTFTAQNQNRIMVIMINGFIVYAPIIDEQITTGELIIPHPLNHEAIQLLQEMARKNVEQHNRT